MSSVWEIPANYMAEDGVAPKLHGIAAAVHDVMTGACPWVKHRGVEYTRKDFSGPGGKKIYWALMDEATAADMAQERVFDAAVADVKREMLKVKGEESDGK